MRFDLSDLRLFAAVAAAGSLTAGARAANLSLASASARIAGMEALLGGALFERGRRGVSPTAAGRCLLVHARDILERHERMRGDLRAFARGLKGRIRMMSITAGLVEAAPEGLRSFLRENPDVDVELEERASAAIVVALAEGRTDLGILADAAVGASLENAGLETLDLGGDTLVPIVASGHRLAERGGLFFAEMLDEPFVGLAAGALHDYLSAQAERAGRRLAFRVKLRSFEGVARMTAAGVGVSILPLAALRQYSPEGLSILRLRDGWARRRHLLCARRFADLPAHALSLVAHLRAAVGETAAVP